MQNVVEDPVEEYVEGDGDDDHPNFDDSVRFQVGF